MRKGLRSFPFIPFTSTVHWMLGSSRTNFDRVTFLCEPSFTEVQNSQRSRNVKVDRFLSRRTRSSRGLEAYASRRPPSRRGRPFLSESFRSGREFRLEICSPRFSTKSIWRTARSDVTSLGCSSVNAWNGAIRERWKLREKCSRRAWRNISY